MNAPMFVAKIKPLSMADPQDAEDAIFWSNSWPHYDICWAGIPGFFPFVRVRH